MTTTRRSLLVVVPLLLALGLVASGSGNGHGNEHSASGHGMAVAMADLHPGSNQPAAPSGGSGKTSSRSRCPKDPPPFIHDTFPQPKFRTSKNGVLSTTLRAALVPTNINGKLYKSSVYEGSYPGPTLMICPGDTLKVGLRNDLTAKDFPSYQGASPSSHVSMDAGFTNLHTHGFFVSPRPPQDDVFIRVPPAPGPGNEYNYRYNIPPDHRPGAYWYHPHQHSQSNVQETGGMSGAIIMRGGLDNRAAYKHIGQRLLVITQTELTAPTPPATIGTTVQPDPTGPFTTSGAQFFVNGKLNPTIPIRPGEIQRWSILNLTANSFVKLELQAQPFELLARDGNYVPTRERTASMLISPSSRREVLVTGGPNGDTQLTAAPFNQFGPNSSDPAVTLATLRSAGEKVDHRMPPRRVQRYPDLRDLEVKQRHRIVYTQTPPNFFINGKQFDPNRIDEHMMRGQVNEWKIVNRTTVWHTFHIHINDFQVTEYNGKKVAGINQQDNVSVPPGGSVKMLYLPKRFTGKFVFHCHILGHEDNGMMGTVLVTPPAPED